jgi:hypothetical protein
MSTRSTFRGRARVAQRNVADYGLADRVNLFARPLCESVEKSYDLIHQQTPRTFPRWRWRTFRPSIGIEPGLALAGGETASTP